MILVKLILVWLVTGCLVHVYEIFRIAMTVHKHGAKFRFEFSLEWLEWLEWTVCDIIMWPNVIRMIDDVLKQIEEELSNNKPS